MVGMIFFCSFIITTVTGFPFNSFCVLVDWMLTDFSTRASRLGLDERNAMQNKVEPIKWTENWKLAHECTFSKKTANCIRILNKWFEWNILLCNVQSNSFDPHNRHNWNVKKILIFHIDKKNFNQMISSWIGTVDLAGNLDEMCCKKISINLYNKSVKYVIK